MKENTSKSLGRDAINLTSSKVITLGISMVSAMLLSRFRTLEEYGTYSQILMVINLVTTLIMLGLPNSINYFLANTETNEERAGFLSTYYTLSTFLSIIVGLALVCTTPLIVLYFNNDLIKNFIYFFAVYPWAKIIAASIDNVLIVLRKTSLLMTYRILNSISLLLILLIVQIFQLAFKDYMIMFVVIEALFAFSVYIIVNGLCNRIYISFNKDQIIRILNFSIPIGLASVVGTINNNLDQLMIGRFYNTEQLAIYANAGRELPVTIIASSLTAVLLPKLVRIIKKNDYKIAVDLWKNSIILSYIIICFLAAGFITFAPDVMKLLYSEKYLSGVSIFRVYNLVLLLRCTYFGIILNASGKTKFILYSSIASLGLNVTLNYVFYKIFGFIGPAISTFVSQFIINFAQLIYTAKTTDVSFSKIFPWKNVGVITSINIFLGLLFYYLKMLLFLEVITGEIVESILLGVIWGAIYIFIVRKNMKENWNLLNGGDGDYD